MMEMKKNFFFSPEKKIFWNYKHKKVEQTVTFAVGQGWNLISWKIGKNIGKQNETSKCDIFLVIFKKNIVDSFLVFLFLF